MTSEDKNQDGINDQNEGSSSSHGAEGHSSSDNDFNSRQQKEKKQKFDTGADDDDNSRGPISFGKGEDPTKLNIETNPGEIITGTWGFLRSILSLRKDTYDVPGVVREIRGGIEFKGYNVWILICSILVASVGLNMNSTAVIVGAMLISPLMGPIRGLGFGVAMNDFGMLIESVKNIGVTVGISIFVATIYFWASPINTITTELEGRMLPTFMDVVIAFFGGLAGVIAAAKGKNDTVIPGVAIATALMPPLCTAGFCLAHGQWSGALGASYLFLLNSLLIALSTIIFIRYLKFPKKEYLSPKIERRVRNYIIIFMILIVSPSGWLFYKMAKRSIFEANAAEFVAEVVKKTDPSLKVKPTYYFGMDSSRIHLEVEYYHVDSSRHAEWERRLEDFDIESTTIDIQQQDDMDSKFDEWKLDLANGDMGVNSLAKINNKLQQKIFKLIDENNSMREQMLKSDGGLEMDYTIKAFHAQYEEISQMSIDQRYEYSKLGVMDTTYLLNIQFKEDVSKVDQEKIKSSVQKRLLFDIKEKTSCDTLIINHMN